MILRIFLILGDLSLDDSYKLNSYRKSVYSITPFFPKSCDHAQPSSVQNYTTDTTHTPTHKYSHTHTPTHMDTHTHTHTHTSTHTHTHTRTHTHALTHAHTPRQRETKKETQRDRLNDKNRQAVNPTTEDAHRRTCNEKNSHLRLFSSRREPPLLVTLVAEGWAGTVEQRTAHILKKN